MKLRALHLNNVRRFAGQRASITGIGDGITVVSEANEFGKSTFFDAIHALFFEKYSGSGKGLKSLQPYAGGAVEIAAEIETEAGNFRVEKRFLGRKTAKVSRLGDGRIVAQDDEAERWISQMLGTPGEGPAGLLWVRQGVVGLEPDTAKEKAQLTETRRDVLSSVAGEIDAMTGGRRMDRVMRRVSEDLGKIATKTGRPTGAWKEAIETASGLRQEVEDAQSQVRALEASLAERKRTQAGLARLDDAETAEKRAKANRDAEAAMQAAEAHAGRVISAQQQHDLAAVHAANASKALSEFLTGLEALEVATARTAEAQAEAGQATALVESAQSDLNAAQAAMKAAREACDAVQLGLDGARSQLAARAARAELSELDVRIAQIVEETGKRDEAQARVKASSATGEWLTQVETAQAEVARLEAAMQARAARLKVAYEGSARVRLDGVELDDGASVALPDVAKIEVPGIGVLTIHSGSDGAEVGARLADATAARDAILARAGAQNAQEATRMAAERRRDEAAVDVAATVLKTLAGPGVEALRAKRAELALVAAQAHEDALPEIAELEDTAAQAQADLQKAQGEEHRCEAAFRSAQAQQIKANMREEAAVVAVSAAQAAVGAVDTRDARRGELLREDARCQEALSVAAKRLQDLNVDAPDLENARSELERARGAVEAAQAQRSQLGLRLAELSTEIRAAAGAGIEEHCAALVGQLERAEAREARFAQEAAALTRLQSALDAERSAAREIYFGPVQEELTPLLSILHRDAALSFDSETMLPTGLTRAASEEVFDDLSGGTQEQIAILTRLAFARLFARQGRHMPIILDDALIYSDDDRIIKMFTALTRVARDQQILVFTCRQLAFQDLGGARPLVDISDA